MDSWTVYLSGEIHSDWRERIHAGVEAAGLAVELVSPVTDHDTSDNAGVEILGAEDTSVWHDSKGARLNDAVVERKTLNVNAGHLAADGTLKLTAGKKRHALVRAV